MRFVSYLCKALTGAALMAIVATPLAAKESLGVFGSWGAFRDDDELRCYAISASSQASGRREFAPFASVGTWPQRQVRGQVHFRTSRRMASNTAVTLRIGAREFALIGSGGNAWARNAGDDAAILSAMRAGSTMVLSAADVRGTRFSNSYDLEGAATALDAASIGCASGR